MPEVPSIGTVHRSPVPVANIGDYAVVDIPVTLRDSETRPPRLDVSDSPSDRVPFLAFGGRCLSSAAALVGSWFAFPQFVNRYQEG